MRALPLADAAQRLRRPGGRPRKNSPSTSPAGIHAAAVRLFDLGATAAYLGVSGWTVRDLEAAGIVKRVRIPLPRGGEVRKLLFDREDLDRLIASWKDDGR